MSKTLDLEKMQNELKEFVKERGFEKYHTPKNLSMALTKEAAELLEIFQWLTEKESFEIKNHKEKFQEVKDEMADILSYLLRIASVLEVDLNEAFFDKIKKNKEKYPLASEKLNFSLF